MDADCIIFQNRNWLILNYGCKKNEVKIHNLMTQEVQHPLLSLSINNKPSCVLYDFPERIPKYIKREVALYFADKIKPTDSPILIP